MAVDGRLLATGVLEPLSEHVAQQTRVRARVPLVFPPLFLSLKLPPGVWGAWLPAQQRYHQGSLDPAACDGPRLAHVHDQMAACAGATPRWSGLARRGLGKGVPAKSLLLSLEGLCAW